MPKNRLVALKPLPPEGSAKTPWPYNKNNAPVAKQNSAAAHSATTIPVFYTAGSAMLACIDSMFLTLPVAAQAALDNRIATDSASSAANDKSPHSKNYRPAGPRLLQPQSKQPDVAGRIYSTWLHS